MSIETAVEQKIVFAGVVYAATKKEYVSFYKINDDGTRENKPLYLDMKREHLRFMIGAIYTGVKFDGDNIYSFSTAAYYGKWKDQADLLAWEAASAISKQDKATDRLEKDAKQVGLIEDTLLPLRMQYDAMYQRRDTVGMHALAHAVGLALKIAPRKTEKK